MQNDLVAYLRQAQHRFADGSTIKIDGLDLRVPRGQKVVLLGPNGSGKTTLLLLLTGLLKADSGVVKLFGMAPYHNFNLIKRKIGVIFQNIEAQLIAPTVLEDISFTPRNYGLTEEDIDNRVRKVMVLIGIEHLRDKIIHYLSGGEKKKVALAGAFVMEPDLLILDEPFAGLDPRSARELTALLQLFNDLYGTTVILSTHNVDIAGEFADQIHVITNGTIVMKGKPADIFQNLAELKKANLHAPGILDLTHELRHHGLEITPTLNVNEALEQLISLIK